jgi:hypothetical protein
MLLLVRMHLLCPTGVDSISDDLPIRAYYTTDEEHLDVMLNSREFRVVNPGLFRDSFTLLVNMHTNGREPKTGLVGEGSGIPVTAFGDNTMLFGLDTRLFTALFAIG